jgi:hypothetical protein
MVTHVADLDSIIVSSAQVSPAVAGAGKRGRDQRAYAWCGP